MQTYDLHQANLSNEILIDTKINELEESLDNEFLETLKDMNDDLLDNEFIEKQADNHDGIEPMSCLSLAEKKISDSIDIIDDDFLKVLESDMNVDNSKSAALHQIDKSNLPFVNADTISSNVAQPINLLLVNQLSSQVKQGKFEKPMIEKSAEKKPSPALLSTMCYTDFARVSDEEAASNMTYSSMRGRSQVTFPSKLHSIIERSELDGYSHIISWLPHGRGFRVHDQNLFLDKILRKYFFQSKMSSFTRQLGMYGFHKIIGKGNRDRGSFFHEKFLRSRPGLCKTMIRMRKRTLLDRDTEPNLSLFAPLPYPSFDDCPQNIAAKLTKTCHPKEIRYSDDKCQTSGDSRSNNSTPEPVPMKKSLPSIPPIQPAPELPFHPPQVASGAANTHLAPSENVEIKYLHPHQISQLLGSAQVIQAAGSGGAYQNNQILLNPQQNQLSMPYIVLRL